MRESNSAFRRFRITGDRPRTAKVITGAGDSPRRYETAAGVRLTYTNMPHLDPTSEAYAARYYRLLEVLKTEGLVEPRYDANSPGEWLAWAHGVRWMIVRASELRLSSEPSNRPSNSDSCSSPAAGPSCWRTIRFLLLGRSPRSTS